MVSKMKYIKENQVKLLTFGFENPKANRKLIIHN